MREILVLLAGGASLDVLVYPGSCSWPEVVFVDVACGFISAWMSG